MAPIARSNVSPPSQPPIHSRPEQSAQAIYKLNAGDYVEVCAIQDSGSPLGITDRRRQVRHLLDAVARALTGD